MTAVTLAVHVHQGLITGLMNGLLPFLYDERDHTLEGSRKITLKMYSRVRGKRYTENIREKESE